MKWACRGNACLKVVAVDFRLKGAYLQLGWISALCSKTRHLIPFTPKICLLCSYYDVSSELWFCMGSTNHPLIDLYFSFSCHLYVWYWTKFDMVMKSSILVGHSWELTFTMYLFINDYIWILTHFVGNLT